MSFDRAIMTFTVQKIEEMRKIASKTETHTNGGWSSVSNTNQFCVMPYTGDDVLPVPSSAAVDAPQAKGPIAGQCQD